MSPQFSYSDLLPIGEDKTKYRNIGKNGVSVIKLGDREFLQVSPEALTLLTETAIHDISHYLRTEHLEQLAKRFRCTYIRTPSNLGPAGARNLGISIAKTDVIMIFDDDDVSLPIRAAVHIENLRSGTQLSYVSSRKIYPNGYSFDAISSNYFGSIKPIEFSFTLCAMIGLKYFLSSIVIISGFLFSTLKRRC